MDFRRAQDAVRDGAEPADVAAQVVAAMTPAERLGCLDGDGPTWAGLGFLGQDGYHLAPFGAARVERLDVPGINFADGPRGCVVGNATAFPVSMARGATWDPDLETRVGEAIGTELRAMGADLTGAVCVNVLRHPAWGRAQETYGEDPHHVGELGAALTRGLQRRVMACVKHFAANSMENARFSIDITVDEVALHEVYLPHFRRIVDEGVASVMTAYNAVNGEWCGQSPSLITDILRGEWGFDGFVISDWIFGLRDAATSLAAGLDIEMPYRMVRAQHLEDALADGRASWDDVDAAATRVVATLLRFDEILSTPPPPISVVGSPEHRALAREVAARSVVLLRNETVAGAAVLPFDRGASVAVLGRLADVVNLGDGGSSDVWDLQCRTVLDGMGEVAAVTHDPGDDVDRAAALAAAADLAVVVVGYTAADEGEYIGETDPSLRTLFPAADDPELAERYRAEVIAPALDGPTERPSRLADRARGFSVGGDRTSLRLGEADVALVRAVAAAQPRTVVVIQAGSAVVVDEWVDAVPAVVQAWYGGCEAGTGLADVLIGRIDPSGRLPFSVPRSEDDLPDFDIDVITFRYDRWHGWWHLARHDVEPRYAFGFGLGYTTFALTGSAMGDGTGSERSLRVTATVANTGDRDGSDVVQVYAEFPDPDRPPRLVGFGRVSVLVGAERTVEIDIPVERLATRDPVEHRWVAPVGRHRLVVARHAGDPDARTHVIEL